MSGCDERCSLIFPPPVGLNANLPSWELEGLSLLYL